MNRVLRNHHVFTGIRPHQILRNMLVHPKDKQELENKCEVVYKIPCKGCDKVYVGETGRNFWTRLNKHRKDCAYYTKNVFYSLRKETVIDRNKQKCDHRPHELHKSHDRLGGLAHCRWKGGYTDQTDKGSDTHEVAHVGHEPGRGGLQSLSDLRSSFRHDYGKWQKFPEKIEDVSRGKVLRKLLVKTVKVFKFIRVVTQVQ